MADYSLPNLELTPEASALPHANDCKFHVGGKCSCSLFWRQLVMSYQKALASERAAHERTRVELGRIRLLAANSARQDYYIKGNGGDPGEHWQWTLCEIAGLDPHEIDDEEP